MNRKNEEEEEEVWIKELSRNSDSSMEDETTTTTTTNAVTKNEESSSLPLWIDTVGSEDGSIKPPVAFVPPTYVREEDEDEDMMTNMNGHSDNSGFIMEPLVTDDHKPLGKENGNDNDDDDNDDDDDDDDEKPQSLGPSPNVSPILKSSDSSSLPLSMDGATVGDYDMKRSPSTAAFLAQYVEDRALYKAKQKLIRRAHLSELQEENLNSESSSITSASTAPVATTIPVSNIAPSSIVVDKSAESSLFIPTASSISDEENSTAEKKKQHIDDARIRGARAILSSTTEVFMEGVESVFEDNFWKCFESKKPKPWNWTIYLWPVWAIGSVFRYCFLFPVRCLIWVLAWIIFGFLMFLVQTFMFRGPTRSSLERNLISLMSGIFCLTWGAVIRYHGRIPSPNPGELNCVFVANHTTMVDVIVLQNVKCFSLVGQRHKGFVRFLQEVVLGCLQCIWFDRGEMKDRAVVAKKLTEHAFDPTRNPLLVFPEGTCVNNEYIIQFKKGVFELGVPICPVAIKYNKMFVDPFWNSRDQSFVMHLVELMTSWCLICDVWFLEPQKIQPGEDAVKFADRVKSMIARRAGLKNTEFDGYMKHWKPSQRFLEGRQKVLGDAFREILKSVKKDKDNVA